ncbi:uncharacterized protein [Desmodus rotundus]|uniref:uncharacterized protein n=1 Tax=Desmodus rotundus TaxID=9430 RepID=UPI002381084F|nr:uncharacterized protein LOC128779730 [Desmodus rotundus]
MRFVDARLLSVQSCLLPAHVGVPVCVYCWTLTVHGQNQTACGSLLALGVTQSASSCLLTVHGQTHVGALDWTQSSHGWGQRVHLNPQTALHCHWPEYHGFPAGWMFRIWKTMVRVQWLSVWRCLVLSVHAQTVSGGSCPLIVPVQICECLHFWILTDHALGPDLPWEDSECPPMDARPSCGPVCLALSSVCPCWDPCLPLVLDRVCPWSESGS